jgi:hypothetical protein
MSGGPLTRNDENAGHASKEPRAQASGHFPPAPQLCFHSNHDVKERENFSVGQDCILLADLQSPCAAGPSGKESRP